MQCLYHFHMEKLKRKRKLRNFQEGFGHYGEQNRSFKGRKQMEKLWKTQFKLDIEGLKAVQRNWTEYNIFSKEKAYLNVGN